MKKQLPLQLLVFFLLLTACEFKVDIKDGTGKIRNGIQLKSNGLHVSQAFLLDEEGKLVSDENLTKVNQYLNLRLIIDSGWSIKDGKVKIGASEKVETNTGEMILDEKDLFAGQDEVNPNDAKVVTLKVVLEKIHKLYDYYLVTFRVWDKNSTAEVSGSYKFNIK